MYLYIKQHDATGLKYFGFTRNKNPFKYKGSGLRWKYHLSKHGRNIHTVDVWGFDDETLCREFALRFSKENDIVNSSEWANLKEENGQPGYTGPRLRSQTPEHKEKIRQSNMGKKCPWTVEYNKTRVFKQSEESRAKISNALKGKKRGPYKRSGSLSSTQSDFT